MNRTALTCFILMLSFLISPHCLFAEVKKDVSDPVLREIIASFSPRMPRFIDKHGVGLFVSDEPITRGGLMMAIYEYDKSLKINKKDFVTRQEFDEIAGKLTSRSGGSSSTAKLDITEVLNDLQPNMPILLDNSLNNSKVFMNFKNEILADRQGGGAAPSEDIRNGITQAQDDIANLSKRIYQLERLPRTSASSGSPSPEVSDETKNELVQAQKELSQLARRIDDLESRPSGNGENVPAGNLVTKREFNEVRNKLAQIERNSSTDVTGDLKADYSEMRRELSKIEKKISDMERPSYANNRSSDGGIKEYTSALTKISIGLGMIAAFFVAR